MTLGHSLRRYALWDEELMLVHLSWKTQNRPIGWSLGYCSSCQQEGAIRLENVLEILSLYEVIPLNQRLKGKIARCDFCQRCTEIVRDWGGVPLADWSPKDGLSLLRKSLGVPESDGAPNPSSDTRLHSLLSSVQQTSSVARLELGPFGILGGIILGALVPIPLAMWLHENKIVQPPPDELGFVLLLSFIGMFLGAILGATAEFLLRRGRSATARIREAYDKYPFDLYRLEELSEAYSKRVRKAVKAVCERVPRGL